MFYLMNIKHNGKSIVNSPESRVSISQSSVWSNWHSEFFMDEDELFSTYTQPDWLLAIMDIDFDEYEDESLQYFLGGYPTLSKIVFEFYDDVTRKITSLSHKELMKIWRKEGVDNFCSTKAHSDWVDAFIMPPPLYDIVRVIELSNSDDLENFLDDLYRSSDFIKIDGEWFKFTNSERHYNSYGVIDESKVKRCLFKWKVMRDGGVCA